MKNFNKMSMVLFDSSHAHFKVSIEAVFTKLNQNGSVTPLAYIGQSGIANLNPNIYLMFTYKSEEYNKGNFLYTSYPQLYKIREAMETLKALIADGSAFVKDEAGNLLVKPEAKNPIIISDIGKQNKWVAFMPVLTEDIEGGVTTAIPGVSIEISSTGGYASVLTVEEFLTLYTIIKDLNLANLQAMMSIAFLSSEDGQFQPQQGYVQQPAYTGYQPQYQPRQQYGNNGGYQPRQPQYRMQQHSQQPQYRSSGYTQRPAPAMTPAAPIAAQPQNNSSEDHRLPPRAQEKQPVMNFDAVEETTINYDDEEGIANIFKKKN